MFSNHRAKQVKRKYPLPHTTLMSSFIFPSSIFILVRLPPFDRGAIGFDKKKICSKKYFQFYFEIWKEVFSLLRKKNLKKKYLKKNREDLVSNEASVCSYTLPPPNSPPLIRLLHLEKERKGKIKFRFLIIIIIIICVRVCVCHNGLCDDKVISSRSKQQQQKKNRKESKTWGGCNFSFVCVRLICHSPAKICFFFLLEFFFETETFDLSLLPPKNLPLVTYICIYNIHVYVLIFSFEDTNLIFKKCFSF